MKVSLLTALLLMSLCAPGAHGQVLMNGRDLVKVSDCPIETPFRPPPNPGEATSSQHNLSFPMDGYVYKRIEFSGLDKPVDLELVWTPTNPNYPHEWHPPMEVFWAEKTTHLTVGGNGPECYVNWFFSPANVPGRIDIRADVPLSGLTVSFSDRPWDHPGECPARQLCPALATSMHQCSANHGSRSCNTFVDTVDRLTAVHQCRRRNDFDAVPAIWVCDEVTPPSVAGITVLEDAMHLLKRLRSAKARKFYRSDQFRGVLDGALAEEYMDDPRR